MLRTAMLSLAVVAFTVGGQAVAQDLVPPEGIDSESWYSEPAPQEITPLQIIQAKAQMRAHQRMARMASMQWYGFSASRPTANATPFTGMYSPAWQMPGGRPFAWTPYQRTTVLIVR